MIIFRDLEGTLSWSVLLTLLLVLGKNKNETWTAH